MELSEAEALIRSGRIDMADFRTFGQALALTLAEYDRRGAELEECRRERAGMQRLAQKNRAELEECRRTRALGGPPPPVDKNWANADVGRPASADDPNAPAHRRDRNGGEPG